MRKRIGYSVIVLLAPYLLFSWIDGRWWITVTIWVFGLLGVWWPQRKRAR